MSVLENGLSLIAVNLPSIWCLFAKVKPESIRRSVRGIFSVHSRQSYTTSMGKPGSHSRLSSLSNNETVFTSSPSHSGHPKAQSIETYAMYDINERDQGARLPQGQIQITDTITQSAVHVWALWMAGEQLEPWGFLNVELIQWWWCCICDLIAHLFAATVVLTMNKNTVCHNKLLGLNLFETWKFMLGIQIDGLWM